MSERENDMSDALDKATTITPHDISLAQSWIEQGYPLLWELFQLPLMPPKGTPDFGMSVSWTGRLWRVRLGIKSKDIYGFASINVLENLFDDLEEMLLEGRFEWRDGKNRD